MHKAVKLVNWNLGRDNDYFVNMIILKSKLNLICLITLVMQFELNLTKIFLYSLLKYLVIRFTQQ